MAKRLSTSKDELLPYLTIALDAMGGDFGPHVTLPAAKLALERYPKLQILLVGNKALLEPILTELKIASHPRIILHHTDIEVRMDDPVSAVLRTRKGSSMHLALELVKTGQAQACVSGGNTGALMALSKIILKLLPGLSRPALVASLPTATNERSYLLDLGANVSADAISLYQFALMGSVLAQSMKLSSNPRVALLNVGEEEIKGSEQVKQAAQLLSDSPYIHYGGFIEGDELFAGRVDVIVTDGFVGNVALKTAEGLVKLLFNRFQSGLKTGIISGLIGKVVKRFLQKSLANINPDKYNGALLLGLRGIVIKSHGRADQEAFVCAIKEAISAIENQLPEKISDKLATALSEEAL